MSEAITQAAAYDLIDRFLRNNLYDDDYAKYSEALEAIPQPAPSPQPAAPVVGDERLLHEWDRVSHIAEAGSRRLAFARAILALRPAHPDVQPAVPVVSGWSMTDNHDGSVAIETPEGRIISLHRSGGSGMESIAYSLALLALRPADHPDTQRCIKARNDLNAALHGGGALIDDLEHAVANACAKLRRPAVEPMTPEQRDAAIDAKLAEYGYPANTRNAARAGWYACLQALGITAKAEGGA